MLLLLQIRLETRSINSSRSGEQAVETTRQLETPSSRARGALRGTAALALAAGTSRHSQRRSRLLQTLSTRHHSLKLLSLNESKEEVESGRVPLRQANLLWLSTGRQGELPKDRQMEEVNGKNRHSHFSAMKALLSSLPATLKVWDLWAFLSLTSSQQLFPSPSLFQLRPFLHLLHHRLQPC